MTAVDLPRPVVAPPVAVVRDFVNTTDFESGDDDLATPAALAAYLRGAELTSSLVEIDAGDLALAHRLRAGLRGALEQNHDGGHGPVELAAALGELEVQLTWTHDGTHDGTNDGPSLHTTAHGAAGGLARIGLAAHECAVRGWWHRLKICSSDECGWAYFDNSKNRSRSWCEYGCGNKIKTRSYRARRRAAAGAAPPT